MEQEEIASLLDCQRVLVAVAPLLGLLGTVLGMIETFHALVQGNVEMTAKLADGIHIALYTTQAGLVAALPGVFALAHLGHLRRAIDKVNPIAGNLQ
jgi:biopolymer transport protein ExbB